MSQIDNMLHDLAVCIQGLAEPVGHGSRAESPSTYFSPPTGSMYRTDEDSGVDTQCLQLARQWRDTERFDLLSLFPILEGLELTLQGLEHELDLEVPDYIYTLF